MQKFKLTRLAAYMVLAAGLAACEANGDGTNGGNGGGGNGGGGNGGTGGSGLITTVQDTLNDLTGGTPLTPVEDLVNSLLDPEAGGLAALTSALEDATADGQSLAQLNQLVGALVGKDDSALTPVIAALNGILSGAGAGGGSGLPVSPAQLCALPGIGPQLASAAGSTCTGGGSGDGSSPFDASQLCAIPGIGPQLASAAGATCTGTGTGGSGNSDGLIATVQDTLNQVTGGTPLQPVEDLVNTLIDPQTGALEALTSQLDAVTSDPEALAQLNALVEALAGENDSALTPLLEALNGVLSGSGDAGGAPAPGDLLGMLPTNPLTDALCGILGC
ncbi:MAG: hypothetical protein V4730_03520 [Pseudomonadota bacterium]